VTDDTPEQDAAQESVPPSAAPTPTPTTDAPSVVELAAALLAKKDDAPKTPDPVSAEHPAPVKAAVTPKPTKRGTAAKASTPPAADHAKSVSKRTTAAKPAAKPIAALKPKITPAPTAPARAPRKTVSAAAAQKPAEKPRATIPPAEKAPPKPPVVEPKPAPSIEPAPERTPKAKKAKLVRDSFTMPEAEYALIAAVKKRCIARGVAVKKSEVLRAAVIGFAGLGDAAVVAAVQSLEIIKTGRPPKKTK
jgi:hypothetical protein